MSITLGDISDAVQSRWQTVSLRLAKRKIAQWTELLPKIASYEEQFQQLNTHDMRKHSLSLRYRIKSHEPVDHVLPEAFALVREAGRRTLNMRHFDVQLVGGIAMHHRSIAEMQTGEGKTLDRQRLSRPPRR